MYNPINRKHTETHFRGTWFLEFIQETVNINKHKYKDLTEDCLEVPTMF